MALLGGLNTFQPVRVNGEWRCLWGGISWDRCSPAFIYQNYPAGYFLFCQLQHRRSYLVSKENREFSAGSDFPVSEGEVPSLSLLRVLALTTDGKQWHKLINGRAHQSWHLGLHFLKDTSEIEPLMLFYSLFFMLWNSSSNTECYFSFLSNFKGISAIKLGVLQPKNIVQSASLACWITMLPVLATE